MATLEYTGSGALSVTFDAEPDIGVLLQEIRLHLNNDSAKLEDYTMTLDSEKGTAFDVELVRTNMQDIRDLVCDMKGFRLLPGDKLVLAWDNSDSRTWGLEIVYDRYC
jgi:hypothetical protein